MDFGGRIAFVTGGGAGIGLGIARALGLAGAIPAIADIDFEAARRAVQTLHDEGVRAHAVHCDVADPASVAYAVADVAGALGGVDILINNAGLHLSGFTVPVSVLSAQDWRRLLDVNVLGVVHCATACRPFMRDRGGGAIVNISSMAGFKSLNAYGVSKLAVRGLTTALAHEFGDDGIRVCGVAPGLVDSETALTSFPEDRRQRYINEIQLIKRSGRVQDVANAVLFLCSDAASFITGETLIVSGGAVTRI